jgi:hypothetical protein
LEEKVTVPVQEAGSVTLTMWHPLSAKVITNFADRRQSVGIVRSCTQAMEFFLSTDLRMSGHLYIRKISNTQSKTILNHN